MRTLTKVLAVVAVATALIAVAFYWFAYIVPFAKLKEYSRSYDPAQMPLTSDKDSYLSFAITPERLQVGLIKFDDGSVVKFWFLSHHVNNGISLAIFRFLDGTEEMMEGFFCCGLEFGDSKPQTIDELRFFIRKNNGAPI